MFNFDQLNPSTIQKPTYIVVGLGNPGPEYKNTRHNAGFWCVEYLAEKFGFPAFSRNNKNVMISTGKIAGKFVALIKPRTFVNQSGHAVETVLKRFQAGIEDLLIVSDDIALPPGKIRLRKQGSSGGHNGLKSIIQIVGSNDFARLRIGVGDKDEGSLVDHVLCPLPEEGAKLVKEALEATVDVIELMLSEGFTEAMNKYN